MKVSMFVKKNIFIHDSFLVNNITFFPYSRRHPRFEESEDSVTEPLIQQDSEMNPVKRATLFSFVRSKENLYSLYVLFLFLITYLLNQLDRYMLAIVTKPLAQVNIE